MASRPDSLYVSRKFRGFWNAESYASAKNFCVQRINEMRDACKTGTQAEAGGNLKETWRRLPGKLWDIVHEKNIFGVKGVFPFNEDGSVNESGLPPMPDNKHADSGVGAGDGQGNLLRRMRQLTSTKEFVECMVRCFSCCLDCILLFDIAQAQFATCLPYSGSDL